MIIIAPSILAADFGRLAQQIKEAEEGGADWIHIDVMDGHFVPNITFGPPIVSSVKKYTKLPLDVHLMIENADKFIIPFHDAGADRISVHQEACPDLHKTINSIKKIGCKAGVVIKPATPVDTLKEYIEEIDLVLIMTVEPGFGNQKFLQSSIKKIEDTRKMIEFTNKEILLEVDGGIDQVTTVDVVNAGANVLVAGTSIFRNNSVKTAISTIRTAASGK